MNAFLEKMGFNETDKVLITHIDDIGFSHASNVASFECLDVGAASCGSILINGPWFREAAQFCKDNPGYDVGVHLTLTCEYDTFRWSALSTRDPASGLLDSEGCLWRTREDAIRNVTEVAAEAEMRAQIETALGAGLEITHIDTHMGSVVHPKFLGSYLKLAQEYRVPAFLPNVTKERLDQLKEGGLADEYLAVIERIDAGKVPTLDEIMIDTLLPMTDKSVFYRELIDSVKPGLTHLLFHPAKMGDELAAIDKRASESRHADYLAFRDGNLKAHIEASGCKLIGYRELKANL
ncbi:MAG: polysaccharide deacetylase family protein [Pseudomonadales bacterium]